MIFAGLIIEVIACFWLMGWFYASTFTGTAAVCVICDCLLMSDVVLPQFLIGTTVILLTEPMSLGSGVSLFSKKLNPEVQGIIIIL